MHMHMHTSTYSSIQPKPIVLILLIASFNVNAFKLQFDMNASHDVSSSGPHEMSGFSQDLILLLHSQVSISHG